MPGYSDLVSAHARVVSRAWNDPGFRQRLVDDPASALKEEGVTVPNDLTVKVVQNTPTLQHLVLPVRPTAGGMQTAAATAHSLGILSPGILGSQEPGILPGAAQPSDRAVHTEGILPGAAQPHAAGAADGILPGAAQPGILPGQAQPHDAGAADGILPGAAQPGILPGGAQPGILPSGDKPDPTP